MRPIMRPIWMEFEGDERKLLLVSTHLWPITFEEPRSSALARLFLVDFFMDCIYIHLVFWASVGVPRPLCRN